MHSFPATRLAAAGRGIVALALALGCWGLFERTGDATTLVAGRCILCNTFGANHAPRICNSCNNKFNNRCILCNAFGANQAPRICNSCNNKFNNRCVLCNTFGANSLPRICYSCDNKF